MDRRHALRVLGGSALVLPAALGLGSGLGGLTPAEAQDKKPAFALPPLGYGYEALEPHIDTATMGFHHKNHHQAFINNLNGLVDKYPELATRPAVEMLRNLPGIPEAVRIPVRNNLGGHWNHTFFWALMTPGGSNSPTAEVKSAIDGAFGSTEKMKDAVLQSALGRFGSGWAWLAVGADKKLSVVNTPYQDTPHMELGAKPLLGIDVWEQAYYLKHQSRRGDYVKAWWSTVNWDKVAENFRSTD